MAIQRLFVTNENLQPRSASMLQTLQQNYLPATDALSMTWHRKFRCKDLGLLKFNFSWTPVDTVFRRNSSVQGFVFAVEYVPVNTINVLIAQSNVFLCSHLHPANTSCVVLVYIEGTFTKNKKMSLKPTTLYPVDSLSEALTCKYLSLIWIQNRWQQSMALLRWAMMI